jgi:hypothetical protein
MRVAWRDEASTFRFMVRVGLGSVLVTIVVACAGRSTSGDAGAGSTDDTGGSAGTTGGSGGTVATGGRGGSATTGGSGGTATSGGLGGTVATGGGFSTGGRGGTGGFCMLPPDPGPCEASVPSYAYDVETGLCLPFIYGGCEGNENRFETAEDCYRMCEGPRVGGTAYCDASVECLPISTRCCACSGFAFENVVGINVQHTPIIQATKCATVDCDACTPGLEWFGATCRDHHCVAWNAREEELTFCTSSDECRLRNGLGCCEQCTSNNENVAVNSAVESEWICPEGLPPCGACPNGGPTYPSNQYAECIDNRCHVIIVD